MKILELDVVSFGKWSHKKSLFQMNFLISMAQMKQVNHLLECL